MQITDFGMTRVKAVAQDQTAIMTEWCAIATSSS